MINTQVKARSATRRASQPGLRSMTQRATPAKIDRSRQGSKHWHQCLNNGKALIDVCTDKSDDALAALTLNLLATLSGISIVFNKVALVLKHNGRFKIEGKGSLTTELGLTRPGLAKRLESLGCPIPLLQRQVSDRDRISLDDLVVTNRVIRELVRQIDERISSFAERPRMTRLKDWPTFEVAKARRSAVVFQKRLPK